MCMYLSNIGHNKILFIEFNTFKNYNKFDL